MDNRIIQGKTRKSPSVILEMKADEQSMTHMRQKNTTKAKAPIFITIGPQCCGKTTWLENSQWKGKDLKIVAIDDHPSVYYPVKLDTFLEEPDDCLLEEDCRFEAEQMVEGVPLKFRLNSPEAREARAVAWFLLGETSQSELFSSIEPYFPSDELLESFITVLEATRKDLVWETETVDLFLPEGIFPRGVRGSQSLLNSLAKKHSRFAVAWGNTNTQAKAYSSALEAAWQTGRPVRFVRWGHELEAVGLPELWRRNAARLAQSGRYIPAHLFQVALARVETLYANSRGGDPRALASLSGYDMDKKGYVQKKQPQAEKKEKGAKPPANKQPKQKKEKQRPLDPSKMCPTSLSITEQNRPFSTRNLNSIWKTWRQDCWDALNAGLPKRQCGYSSITTCFAFSVGKLGYHKNPGLFQRKTSAIQQYFYNPMDLSLKWRVRNSLMPRSALDEWGKKRKWRRNQWDAQDMNFEFHQYDVEDRTIFEISDEIDEVCGKPKRNDSVTTREWDTWQLVKQIRSGQYRIK